MFTWIQPASFLLGDNIHPRCNLGSACKKLDVVLSGPEWQYGTRIISDVHNHLTLSKSINSFCNIPHQNYVTNCRHYFLWWCLYAIIYNTVFSNYLQVIAFHIVAPEKLRDKGELFIDYVKIYLMSAHGVRLYCFKLQCHEHIKRHMTDIYT